MLYSKKNRYWKETANADREPQGAYGKKERHRQKEDHLQGDRAGDGDKGIDPVEDCDESGL